MGRDGTRGDSRLLPNYLSPVQHRPPPTEMTTLPTQRTPLPGTTPRTQGAEAPVGLGVLSGRPPGSPQRNHRRTDGPRGPARLRQGPGAVPQRGASLASPLPVPPAGTGGITRFRHPPGHDDQDRSGGPPARPPTRRGNPARTQAQPRQTTPLPDPRETPTAPPSPTPTSATAPQQPNPAARPRTPARTHRRHTRTTNHAGPEDMAPRTPPPRPCPPDP